jgi:transposase
MDRLTATDDQRLHCRVGRRARRKDDSASARGYQCLGRANSSVLESAPVIQITPHMRILLAVQPVDFRKGIDGLAGLCRQALAADPMAGALIVFCSRNRRALKLLTYDGQGFWLAQKRLSKGRFTWWPGHKETNTLSLDAHQLQMLLWNGNPARTQAAPMWRPVNASG